jgi:hypothetical protein
MRNDMFSSDIEWNTQSCSMSSLKCDWLDTKFVRVTNISTLKSKHRALFLLETGSWIELSFILLNLRNLTHTLRQWWDMDLKSDVLADHFLPGIRHFSMLSKSCRPLQTIVGRHIYNIILYLVRFHQSIINHFNCFIVLLKQPFKQYSLFQTVKKFKK